MLSKKIYSELKKGSPIRKAFESAQELRRTLGAENVFDFSIGNPAAPTPEKVRESVIKLMDMPPSQLHSYMNDAGYEEVREKIALSVNKRFSTSFSQKNIIMCTGAAGGINIVMNALIDSGDEAVIFKPYYPGYLSFISNWDGTAAVVDADEETFQPDLEDLKNKITKNTKVVIINSPNNPSGVIYTEDTVIRISEILKEKQREYNHAVYLISDEPYREIVYSGEELPCWANYYNNSIIIYSFSKSLSIPGERIGYIVIPDEIEEFDVFSQIVRLSSGNLGYVNAPSLFQRVVADCLNESVDIEFYRRNRDALYEKLTSLGFSMANPDGAFYLFIKTPVPEEEFLEKALEQGIVLVGGSAFGMKDYVRLSFCIPYKTVMRSFPSFEKLAYDCNIYRGN